MKHRDKDFYNASGGADPTAYRAIKNIEQEENVNRLIKTIKALIAESGFELLNRIILKDVKNGKIFK